MATLRIHESRRLVIPLETAVDAVLQLDWEHGGWLAEATLTDARIEAGENPGLVIGVMRKGTLEPMIRKYTLPAVAAAIINLCRKARIPLPHNWPKRLEIVPEGFEFSLQGTVQFPRHHGPLPGAVAAEPPAPSKTAPQSAQDEQTAKAIAAA